MNKHEVDEAAGRYTVNRADVVLKLYGISSLNPQSWESVDHDKDGPLAGTTTGEDGKLADELDPLGLKGRLSG
jgi:exocyst complex component 2